jgi:hypothetical protein
MKYLNFIIYSILAFTFFGCSNEVTRENYDEIITSGSFQIEVISYRGNISGSSKETDNKELLQLECDSNTKTLTYHKEISGIDTTFQLSDEQFNRILDFTSNIIRDHNSEKEYSGSCMGLNRDFKLKSEALSILIKPEGESEYQIVELLDELEIIKI